MLARRQTRTLAPVLLALVAATAACARSVDIKQTVEMTGATSGWFDAGFVGGKNKIVPSVSFRLKKKPDSDLSALSLNVVFRHPAADGASSVEDWDEVFIQHAPFKDANETETLTIRPNAGYTGDPPQSRLDILNHRQFRDVRAHVFAKVTSSQWVELGTIDVKRELIVR
jgi:hypothetical protein